MLLGLSLGNPFFCIPQKSITNKRDNIPAYLCFMTIAEASRRMDSALIGLDNEIAVIMNAVEPDIVIMQVDRLNQGLFVDETLIEPDYKPFTVQEKLRKGQNPDLVTLRDTGEFHNAIFAAQFGEEIIIDSNDDKSGELKEKYTEKIFGLTPMNKSELQLTTISMLRDYIANVTGF